MLVAAAAFMIQLLESLFTPKMFPDRWRSVAVTFIVFWAKTKSASTDMKVWETGIDARSGEGLGSGRLSIDSCSQAGRGRQREWFLQFNSDATELI